MSGEVVPFISDRALREELKQYLYGRFDYHLERADSGEITRDLAIAAFFAEMSELSEDNDPDEAA